MASIDERIVEMKFRRDDFLKGTDETLNALGRLEQSLNGGSGIAAGVAKIGSKFSVMGAVGMGALLKVGGAAVAAGAKLASGVMEPIFGGGKRRAINLEQASFMLNNVTKDAGQVANIMSDVNYAVEGTAFGLDQAALAAAQFAAGGMRSGDLMKASLRGISGVASMTASSYDDISQVFTKVAGQGRVMGDDLLRLSSRGINAASTMTDYYKATGKFANITEAELRDMVTKGKVSFEDFAKAMDSTFGEDAKRANDIYTGSLANIKAALARIGADAFVIEHEKMRRVFNALRPGITHFQKSLKDLWWQYKTMIAMPFAEKVERWGKALEQVDWTWPVTVMRQFINIGVTIGNVVGTWLAPIQQAFDLVFKDTGGRSWLEKLSRFLDGFRIDIAGLSATEGQASAVTKAFVGIFEIVKAVGSVVGDVFGAILPVIGTLARAVGTVLGGAFGTLGKVAGSTGSPVVSLIELIGRGLVGAIGLFGSALEYVAPVADWLWDKIMVGVGYVIEAFEWLKPKALEFFDYLFGQEGKVNGFFDRFKESVRETGSVFETVGIFITSFYKNHILPYVTAFKDLGDAFKTMAVDGFSGFKKKVEEAFKPLEHVRVFLQDIWKNVKDTFAYIKSPFKWIQDQLPGIGTAIESFIKKTQDAWKGIDANFESVLGPLGKAFGDMIRVLGKLFEDVTIDDIIKYANGILKLVFAFKAFQTLNSVKGTFDSISGFFDTLSERLKLVGVETKTDKLLKIAIALGIMAAALWLIAQLDPAALARSVAVIAVLGLVLLALSAALSVIPVGTITSTAIGLGLLAIALGLLVIPLVILGLLPYDVISQGMYSVLILLGALVIATQLMGETSGDMIMAGFGLLMIAAALTLLLIPITILGEMDKEVLAQGLTALGIALFALVAAAIFLGTAGPNMILGAIAMAIMAAALMLIVIPLERLSAMEYDKMIESIMILVYTLGLLVAAAFAMQTLGAGAVGLLAIAVALVVLAFGISMLASVDPAAAGTALLVLTGALVALVAASAISMAVLPGMLALAGLILAFGIAVVLAGAGAVLFAFGAQILAGALPGLVDGLLLFAAASEELQAAAPAMIEVGIALGIFAIGTGLAGVAALAAGIGLLMLGVGLSMMASTGDRGTKALLDFVEAIKPLLWEIPRLLAVAAAIAALGAAMILLGVGLLLAGIGMVALGLGAIIATIGMTLFFVIGALVAPLADRIVDAFTKIGGVIGYITGFSDAVLAAAGTLSEFKSQGEKAATAAVKLTDAFQKMIDVLGNIGLTLAGAADQLCAALQQMITCSQNAASALKTESANIGNAFSTLSAGILANTGPANSAVSSLTTGIVSSLSTGAGQIKTQTLSIVLSFTTLNVLLKAVAALIKITITNMMRDMKTSLETGKKNVDTGVVAVVSAFDKLKTGIESKSGEASGAVRKVVSAINSALFMARGSIAISAYGVGTSVGSGMAAGIRASSAQAASAAARMGANAIASAKAAIKSNSPSKEFMQLGNWSVDGFVIPFTKRLSEVESVSETMASASVDAFTQIVSQLEGELDGFDDFNPTITPVLDLDLVRKQAGGLNGMLGGEYSTDFGGQMASSLAVLEEALREVSITAPESEAAPVSYTQNNYSPKALDPVEVYRNTKNLISVMDRKET